MSPRLGDEDAQTRLIALLEQRRERRLDRRAFLERLGRITGGVAAASLLAVALERQEATAAASLSSAEWVMLSLREISDRLEIQQNLWDYANAVDLQEFDALDAVFTPDARLSYGSRELSLGEAKTWLREALTGPGVQGYFHMMGAVSIELRGDTAESRTRCFNPMEFAQKDGQIRLWLNGIWYHWQHVRTPQGWRIARRLPPETHMRRAFGWSTPPFPTAAREPPVRRPR